jgi:hypothetical protein
VVEPLDHDGERQREQHGRQRRDPDERDQQAAAERRPGRRLMPGTSLLARTPRVTDRAVTRPGGVAVRALTPR